MLQSIKGLFGEKLGASDGDIGHVEDLYFDDQNWAVRYVVANTGSWLPGRQVLIAPHAFGNIHVAGKALLVNLTRKEIENSPPIESHKPVSRQYEEAYYRYYGWPCYWQGGGLWGMSGFPSPQRAEPSFPDGPVTGRAEPTHRADAHLRSVQAMHGYSIKHHDEIIGEVCDFMMDGKRWAIRELVGKTGNWLSGKEVSIPTGKVDRISFEESTVFVSVPRASLVNRSAHAPVAAG